MKKKPFKAKTTQALTRAINRGWALDKRTSEAKAIQEVKSAIRDDLDGTARALLEDDCAVCCIIQKLALARAFSDPDNLVDDQGRASYAVGCWRKYANQKKSILVALKKFQARPEPEDSQRDLADLILEVSDPTEQPQPSDHAADVDNDGP